MTSAEIAFVTELCRMRAGLAVGANPYLIESRLEPVARGDGLADVSELLAAVRRGATDLAWKIVEAMACIETSFFDDKAVFHVFETEIWPRLESARDGAPVRVWSAGCATGQEVYSLAMLADHARETGRRGELALAASDISAGALERAKSGLYTQFEVQRGLPIRLLIKHFEKIGEMWRLSAEIRRQVRWRRVNLVADLSGIGVFDVIFCRHVLTGMDPESQTRVLCSLAGALADEGCLILGSGEDAAATGEAFSPTGHAGIFRVNPAMRAAAA